VVVHAVRRSNLRAGDRVLVLGAGAVGLLTLALARASGATITVAIDIDAEKLAFAKTNGWASSTYTLEKGPRTEGKQALQAANRAWTGLRSDASIQDVQMLDEGFDIVFECTGVESCMQLAILVGIYKEEYPGSG
jgi:L-iditol 2-dehydrogenase